MIVLFSDFGLHGPYTGEVKAVLYQHAPQQKVIDLFSDAPVFDVRCSAYLLAAFVGNFPSGTVFCAVIDPVASSADACLPIILTAAGQQFVGPDNGLFSLVAGSDPQASCRRIDWQPDRYFETFRGRDLFAPVAARLANHEQVASSDYPLAKSLANDWPQDYNAVIYIDHFGNAMTGIQAASVTDDRTLLVAESRLRYASHYSRVDVGQAFWYRNANGLVEIAINQGHAGQRLGLKPGLPVTIE